MAQKGRTAPKSRRFGTKGEQQTAKLLHALTKLTGEGKAISPKTKRIILSALPQPWPEVLRDKEKPFLLMLKECIISGRHFQ